MSRRSDYSQVAAAFALPLVLVAVAGWFGWQETSERSRGEMSRTADAAAEYAERVFTSAVLAARLTNTILNGVSDTGIRADEAFYHARLAEIIPELPASNMITVSDREGTLLVMSNTSPVPPVSVADREWFRALQAEGGPSVFIGKPSTNRVTGNPFFSVGVRRSETGNGAAEGAFDGHINVSLDPLAVALSLRTITQQEADVVSLVRADGEILASTLGATAGISRVPDDSPLLAAIAAGETRGIYEGRTLGLREGSLLGGRLLIAYRNIGALPVYVTVSRPPAAIRAPWLRSLAAMALVGIPASLALGLLSLMALRRRDALHESAAELDAAFENSTTGTALVDGESDRILKVNKRLCEIAGRDAVALVGGALGELARCDPTANGPLADSVAAGTSLCRLERPDGCTRWVELGTSPVLRRPGGAPKLVIATLHDVTERRESQKRQTLLMREVDHRAKNVLAVVQAVIRLARTPEARPYAETLEARVQALARAHELLARDQFQSASLRELVHNELTPYQDGAKTTADGPDIALAPNVVQPMSMALHELATNALKHGALSHPDGSLSVTWDVPDGSDEMVLHWSEHHQASRTAAPGKSGTGLSVLRGSVEQFGGSLALEWCEGGLSCHIGVPASAILHTPRHEGGPRPRTGGGSVAPCNADLTGLRVLLAEDETIVAMDLKDLLQRLGCVVSGPARTLKEAEALAARESGRLDVALLDVNLRGATTIALARTLTRAGVACIFVTGYSALPAEELEDGWFQLQKPVTERQVVAALRQAKAAATA